MPPFETALPAPDAEARAHSDRVTDRIRAEIDAAGGWIAFSRYMELALYAPGLGYYVAGASKFGRGGDFVTAPEMTPLFASSLAVQIAAILAATRRRGLLEVGGGTGRLAADLLNALAACNALPSQYSILETSPELRERQRTTIARDAPLHCASVRWVDTLPSELSGAVIANEVLDAIPVHLIAHRGGEWRERGVVISDQSPNDPWRAPFAWAERAADSRLAALTQKRYPPAEDYLSELNPAAEAWVETIGQRIIDGALLVIDYGFPATEYYHPQRSAGTLMCHYRHRIHHDPFVLPGLSDITAHVDFSAIAAAGERAGLSVAGFTSQAPFLAACGILDMLKDAGKPESLAYLKASAAVQMLLSPAEMGELFKVLALARKPDDMAWPGFALVDRSDRL